MKHMVTRTIYSYWTKLRGDRIAPDRREIEPAEIRHILGDTFILEVEDSDTLNFRLAGTRICSIFGRELKGRNVLSLLSPADADALRSMTAAVVEDGAAAVVGLKGVNDRGAAIMIEMILMPLTHQGHGHNRILGSIVAMEEPYWLGVQPIMQQSIASLRVIWPDERPSFLSIANRQTAATPHVPHIRVVPSGGEGAMTPDRRNTSIRGFGLPELPFSRSGSHRNTSRNESVFDQLPGWIRRPPGEQAIPEPAMLNEIAVRRVNHLTVIDGGRSGVDTSV